MFALDLYVIRIHCANAFYDESSFELEVFLTHRTKNVVSESTPS